jgi:hypothetical protein
VRAEEIQGLSQLARLTLRGGTTRIHEVHQGLADRTFRTVGPGDDDRPAFPPDRVHRLGGLRHFDLLNHPLVYARLEQWLVERPEGARPPAPI